MKPDLEYLQTWVGRTETDRQLIDTRTIAQMAGTLGLDRVFTVGDVLPMPWHWLFFTPVPHAALTGDDGHPVRGGFLPPVLLPRRMWAGSQVSCHQALRVGDTVNRVSRVKKVTAKSGRTGQLVFVTVEHQIYSESEELLITESQDLVYREPGTIPTTTTNTSPDPYKPPLAVQWSESVVPDPVLLFRYSALTFNGHRIHYDRDYAVNVEGYPGLVVHGPLTVSMLLKLMYRHLGDVGIKSFSFRGSRPLFDTDAFSLEGGISQNIVKLWALTPSRHLAMSLDVELTDNKNTERCDTNE